MQFAANKIGNSSTPLPCLELLASVGTDAVKHGCILGLALVGNDAVNYANHCVS